MKKVIEKIQEATYQGRLMISCSFDPPHSDDGLKKLMERKQRLVAELNPSSIFDIAHLALEDAQKSQLCAETMVHLTSGDLAVDEIKYELDVFKRKGMKNVVALRGDGSAGQEQLIVQEMDLGLVEHIRAKYGDYFGITVASYPEAHRNVTGSNGADTLGRYQKDLAYLKRTVDAGADLIIATLFYDPDIFLKFVDDCRQVGITCPIVPGIMSIMDYKSFCCMTGLSETLMSSQITDVLALAKDNEEVVRNYGIHLGIEMCKKILSHGIKALHFYTMNEEDFALATIQNLGLIDTSKISRPLLFNMEIPTTTFPWLMLTETPKGSLIYTLYSIPDKKSYKLLLPELQGKTCAGSSEGWLLTVDLKLQIRLLNPFTRTQIRLPPQPTFEYQLYCGAMPSLDIRWSRYMHKLFLSCNPLSGDCVVLALHHLRRRLAFCRPGSTTWTTIDAFNLEPFTDATFYQGRFYAISHAGLLVVCDLGLAPRVRTILAGPKEYLRWWKYLISISDTLLLVLRDREAGEGKYRTTTIQVLVLVPDTWEGSNGGVKWKKVTSLRNLALFIGGSSSMGLHADECPGIKRNCIYFTDDYFKARSHHADGAGSDLAVYNYEDGTIDPIYPSTARSILCPPIWVKPL